MAKAKRSWDILSEEKKRRIIGKIIEFFKNERDEEIGVIAAESVLDFFLRDVGTGLYNKGIEDSQKLLKSRIEDIELDMDSLLKEEN